MKSTILTTAIVAIFIQVSAQNFSGSFLSCTHLSSDVGDIDSDGDLDIVTGGMRQLSWEENAGTNVFVNHAIAHTQTEVQGVVIADLDQDGYQDIISASLNNSLIIWNRNNGNNVFTSNIISSSAAGPAGIDAADMDNDGDIDIVFAAFTGDKFSWLKNNGSQSFTLVDIATSMDGALKVRCTDADNDGDQDLFAAAREGGKLLLFRNDGVGNFTQVVINASFNLPRDIREVDFDLDGDMDFLYCGGGGYGWYRNDGTSFTQVQIWTYGLMYGINYGDLNNNGEWDIVLADYSNENITSILDVVNDGTDGDMVNTWVDYASMVFIRDFNNDGFEDVLCAGSYDVKIALNINATSFTELPVNKTLNDVRGLAHGDFDNDGDVDLIGVGYLNLFWFRNENNGEYTPIRIQDAETYGWITVYDGIYIRAGDIDGDGDTDAVYSENNADQVNWLENDGGGDFIYHDGFSLVGVYSLDLVDFDGDDDLDVLTTEVGTSSISWFENNGNGTGWTEHSVNYTFWYPFQAVAVDYDDDGYMDVLAAHAGNSDQVNVYVNEGDNENFITRELDSDAPGANSVYYTDIDLDGDMDLLAAISEDNKIKLYKSNGAAYPIFTQSTIATGIDGVTYVYADDYDGDGDIDVVCSSLTDKDMDVLINDGTGSFTRIGLNTYADDAQFIESGDLDDDGIPEIYGVAADYGIVEVFKLTPYIPPPPVDIADCSELFFSEYVEGSSYNKVLEIYNPTGADVNLLGYKVEIYSNGSTSPSQSLNLSGIVASHDVFVITTSLADLDFYFAADLIFGLNFNGDDAITLTKNGEIIDAIGVIGQDPGTAWTGSGGSSTLDKTLVRKYDITVGNNSGQQTFDPSVEWDVYSVDNPFYIGFHDGICNTACVASVSITTISNNICQGDLVVFDATVANEGSAPIYQWKRNGNNVGTNSSQYSTSDLVDNDVITCSLTTDAACAINTTVTSNSILINVNSSQNPTIAISASATSICSGATVTFNASATNTGSNPTYQWKKNGLNVGNNSSVYVVSNLINGDQITCTITSNAPCITTSTVTSNTIVISITSAVTPSVVISVPSTSICSGASTTFTAAATNGGSTPSYQWKKNGSNVGTNSSTYTVSNLANGDIISCLLTSNASCATTTTASSNNLTMTVSTSVTPSLFLSSSTTSTCANGLVVFTAFPQNGGSSPSYVWYQNGQVVSTNGNGWSGSSWTTGTQIYVTMTSNAACAVPSTVTSNTVTLTVSPTVTPSVSISANQTSICSGNSVTFTATPINGGTTPSYQWKKNGTNVGGNSATYTSSSLVNGDLITCVLTSSAACPTSTTATSNTITMSVTTSVTPTLSISASQTSICSGTSVTFTAVPMNGGTSPSYQWKKNGSNTGTNSPTLSTSALNNGDIITCVMTSNASCLTSTTATSNAITITVSAAVTPSVSISTPSTSICQNTSVTFTASPQGQGTSPTYTWYKNGQVTGTNSSTLTITTLTNGDEVYVVLTSNSPCATQPTATSNTITVTVTAQVTPTCVITTGSTTVCAGTNVTFVATPTNGGSSPSYQWKKNGSNVGSNASSYSNSTLLNGDIITCVMTSNALCTTTPATTSNSIMMTVTPTVAPTINITSDVNDICSGAEVVFTALISNGGTTPSYQWKINGENAGTNLSQFNSSTLNDGDIITCTLTSNANCASSATVNSNSIVINVAEPVTPSVSIETTATEVCENDNVIITATAIHGGTNPGFVWYQNGSIVSTSGNQLILDNLTIDSDIYVTMTSNAACLTTPSANSAIITITIAEEIIPAITISTPSFDICSGETVQFTASPVNGGSDPIFQWKKNGSNVGTNSAQYTSSILQNGDAIQCVMTSSSGCASNPTALSNVITLTVTPTVTPFVSITTDNTIVCENETLLFELTSQNGGENPGYFWYVNDQQMETGSSFNYANPQNNDIVSCILISDAACVSQSEIASNQIILTVSALVMPVITITTESLNICAGEEVTILTSPQFGGVAPTFNWYINGQLMAQNNGDWTTNIIQNNDQIICEMNSNESCASTQLVESNMMQFSVTSVPTPIVQYSSGVLSCLDTPGASYQWYLENAALDGAIENTYVPTIDGNYYITIQIGDCIATSEVIAVTTIGIEEESNVKVSIYPNPARSSATIEGITAPMTVSIFDSMGKLVQTGNSRFLDVTDLRNGVYHVEIRTSEMRIERRLVKAE